MKSLPTLTDFTLGELAPTFFGRFDSPSYRKGAMQLNNFIPYAEGGFAKRPGFLHVGSTNGNNTARIYPLVVTVSEAYVLEFTASLLRVWKIPSSGLPTVLATTYATSYSATDIFELNFAWSYPYFFIAHQSHPVAYLYYNSTDSFTFVSSIKVSGVNPTFFTGNTHGTTTIDNLSYTPDGSEVGQAITGSGIPNGATITNYSSSSLTISSAATSSGTSVALTRSTIPENDSALPFQSSGNYPKCVAVAFQRVWFANTTNNPLGLWASAVGIFDSNSNISMATYEVVAYQYSVMAVDGSGQPTTDPPTWTTETINQSQIGDADAIELTINSDKDDEILWITPSLDLFLGTSTGEWVIPANSTANNIASQLVSRTGSTGVQPQMVNGGCVFVRTYGRRISQIGWQGVYNPYVSPQDLTFFSWHLFESSKATDFTFVQNPITVTYFLRDDGVIAACVLNQDYNQLEGRQYTAMAWHRLSSSYSFTSICVAPGSNRDLLFAIVDIGGSYYLEMLDDINWYDSTVTNGNQAAANYLDCSVTKTSGTAFTSVTGLDHLDGLTVGMVGDGAYQGTATVSGGAVTLPTAAKTAHVGLEYTATFQSMPIEIGDVNNSTVGMVKNVVLGTIRMIHTLDLQIGPDGSDWDSASLNGVDVTAANPTLFTGDEEIGIRSDPRSPAYVYIQSAKPLPCSVTAISLQDETA